ncbi:hypothetical protein NWT39_11185 [Nitrososphaera viennensis]|uniref:Uncharacterized protein n=1 Tax=Nitrososphaera viennensis TaxID=1034015 RepID=A0A977ICH9_9ARCH|nr:hypothetical protein [Nitrososphaera viennensis]UVS68461.1 hypothetical protein NWT39_11185 [Nitrososphaera viennensis]
MHYKKLSEFYRNFLEIMVAVIIGQSFVQVDHIFIPFSNVLSDYRSFIDASGMLMVYFIVVSGWIGYHRSITKNPHKGKLGNARFVVDLVVVFLTYYIVSVANPESKGHFGDIFQWILPIMFGLYLLWDILKILEYREEEREEHKIRVRRMIITATFFALFIAFSFLYQYQLSFWDNPYPTTPPWNKTHFDFTFIIYTFALVFFYRGIKWPVKGKLPKPKKMKAKANAKVDIPFSDLPKEKEKNG